MKHERGVVSTIRIPDKLNSDGAQFLVCVVGQPPFDGQYSAFEDLAANARCQRIHRQTLEDPKVTIEKKREEPFLSVSPEDLRRTVTLRTTLGHSRSGWSRIGLRITRAIS